MQGACAAVGCGAPPAVHNAEPVVDRVSGLRVFMPGDKVGSAPPVAVQGVHQGSVGIALEPRRLAVKTVVLVPEPIVLIPLRRNSKQLLAEFVFIFVKKIKKNPKIRMKIIYLFFDVSKQLF